MSQVVLGAELAWHCHEAQCPHKILCMSVVSLVPRPFFATRERPFFGDFWFWAQFLRKSVKYRDTQLAINPFTCASKNKMKKRVCHCLGLSRRSSPTLQAGTKMSNTAPTGPSRSSRKLLELRSTVQIAILLPNNCYVSAIMQCLFNNPKMTIFDQLTAGHPSQCDIVCCMSDKCSLVISVQQ